MLSSTCLRSARGLARLAPRSFTTTARQLDNKSVAPTPSTDSPVPKTESQLPAELPQAPNRKGIWSRSQRPRNEAMTGPRFEQTDFDLQVRMPRGHATAATLNEMLTVTAAPILLGHGAHPQAARPLDSRPNRGLRWRRRPSRTPPDLHQHRQARDCRLQLLRSPIRTFTSTGWAAKHTATWANMANQTYQANEHHREHLQSLPQTSYPLEDVEGVGETPPLSRPHPPH